MTWEDRRVAFDLLIAATAARAVRRFPKIGGVPWRPAPARPRLLVFPPFTAPPLRGA